FVLGNLAPNRPPADVQSQRIQAVVAMIGLLATPVVLYLVLARAFTRGSMRLQPDGIVLGDRRSEVFCPWGLFQSNRKIRCGRWDWIELWVSVDAVPDIIHTRDGYVLAQGAAIQSRQFKVVADDVIALRNWYKVSLREHAPLLPSLASPMGAKSGGS